MKFFCCRTVHKLRLFCGRCLVQIVYTLWNFKKYTNFRPTLKNDGRDSEILLEVVTNLIIAYPSKLVFGANFLTFCSKRLPKYELSIVKKILASNRISESQAILFVHTSTCTHTYALVYHCGSVPTIKCDSKYDPFGGLQNVKARDSYPVINRQTVQNTWINN